MIELADKYGVWVLFAIMILERIFPILSTAFKQLLPAQIKLRMMQEQQKKELQKEAIETSAELDARKIDLREREVLAMENIAKHMILTNSKLEKIDDRLDMHERTVTQVSISLATSNQTLAILLDRNARRRRSDGGSTQPMKRIEK